MSSKKINKLIKFENILNDKNDILLIKEQLYNIINTLKSLILKNLDDNIERTIKGYFIEINNIFQKLINSLNFAITTKNQYENIQRKEEQDIRILYGKIFHEKLMNEILENKIYYLTKKEKEYDLLKQKTGAIVCNGKVICNERKDNEIIILRTENSLLKTNIKNNEDLIKEKNDIINTLNDDILLYKTQIDELRKIKGREFTSFSNINININEPKKNYKKNTISNNNKSYVDSIQISSSSSKKNKNINNNKNFHNNIYSSYQINSQLINKFNNNKSAKKDKKEECFNTNNNNSQKKNKLNKNNLDNTNTNSLKYISVNKSLFNPPEESKINKNNNNENKSRQLKKKRFMKPNNNMFFSDYNTISNDINKKKGEKIKKKIISNRIYINHRKANSIQISENSLKKMSMTSQGKNNKYIFKEKNINNSNNVFSVLRKISEIKNKSFKKFQPSSMTIDNLKPDKNTKADEYLDYTMMPYQDKKNNKGRNEKYKNSSKLSGDNSFNFMNKSSINKTYINQTIDNYPNFDKNKFNEYYNN